MNKREELEKRLLEAIKSRDEVRRNTLRMALSSIQLAQIEKGEELDENAVLGILRKEIKTREETIAEAEKANRPGMIPPLEAEILILKEYLPREMTDQELTTLIKKIILDSGASTIKEMGAVMKKAIEETHGQAANDRISKIIRELLA